MSASLKQTAVCATESQIASHAATCCCNRSAFLPECSYICFPVKPQSGWLSAMVFWEWCLSTMLQQVVGWGWGGGGVVVEVRCSGQQGLQPQRPDMLQQRKDLIQVLLLSDCGCLITAIICANAPVQSPLLLCGHHYRTVPHLLRAVTAEQSPQLCKLPYAVTALLPAPRCCITLHCCHLSSSCFASHFYPKAD